MLLPENWRKSNKPEVECFSGNAFNTNSNNWKKCEGAERDIMQCINYVFQPEYEHMHSLIM